MAWRQCTANCAGELCLTSSAAFSGLAELEAHTRGWPLVRRQRAIRSSPMPTSARGCASIGDDSEGTLPRRQTTLSWCDARPLGGWRSQALSLKGEVE